MASRHEARPRKLFEVLEEKQEPFREYGIGRKKRSSWRCLPNKLRCWEIIRKAYRAPHYRGLTLLGCFPEVRSKRYVADLSKDFVWEDCELSPVSVLDNRVAAEDDNPVEDADVCFLLPLFKEESGEKTEDHRACSWENQWGDEALVTDFMSSDFDESRKNWTQFHDQRRELCFEIEGFIFQELREECVLDMLGLYCTLSRYLL